MLQKLLRREIIIHSIVKRNIIKRGKGWAWGMMCHTIMAMNLLIKSNRNMFHWQSSKRNTSGKFSGILLQRLQSDWLSYRMLWALDMKQVTGRLQNSVLLFLRSPICRRNHIEILPENLISLSSPWNRLSCRVNNKVVIGKAKYHGGFNPRLNFFIDEFLAFSAVFCVQGIVLT